MEKSDSFYSEPKKKSGCQVWQVAIICSVLIAIGLGVGLGVGLANQTTVINEETTTCLPATTTGSVPTTGPTTPSGSGPWENYRLPSYIIPTVYDLLLHPNMSTDDYTGRNAMTLNITQGTKYILVHADAKLSITSSRIQMPEEDGSFSDVTIEREFRVPENEYYVVETQTMLTPKDGYVLTLEFYGSLLGKVVGLYKSVYTIPETGLEEAMVGSDMEPTDARKAYPCFDEPALKIRYRTKLVHLPNHIALSNTEVQETMTRPDGLNETWFVESVPMSSYLGCFAIGDFVYIEEKSSRNNIPLRVYVPPHQLNTGRADYALRTMKLQFDYFEDLFEMDYSLNKLDMISIPDFGTGAMENWGLVTYRETNLLWDPKESSTANKQRVAAVIAHELVHQWFGNIVTMKWWDNLWLNEGFASYLEYFGLHQAEPSWQAFDHFVADDLQRVMVSDDTVTSHPIVVNVSTPSQITSVFDTITYSKGAAVLRYLHDILGNDTFFGGIKHYLKVRKFSNADEQDLFHDMQEYADQNNHQVDIAKIMNPLVHQMGFPVVTVAVDGTATQDHFLRDPNANRDSRPASVYDYKWDIDVTYITSANDTIQRVNFGVEDKSISLNFDPLDVGEWVKVNPGVFGYYRIDYDDVMWENYSQQLMTNHLVLAEADRSNLIDDAFNLAPAKLLGYTKALDMTQYLSNETSYFVWNAYNRGSSYIRSMLESTPIYQDFKAYYVTKVKPIADALGWNASVGTPTEKLNRVLVLSLALAYGDEEALDNATSLFESWINNETFYLYPDLRQLVYRYGVIAASTTQWEEMLRRYVSETVASEQTNLLRGLTSTQDISLLDRMLDNCFNQSVVKSQEFFDCVTYISYSQIGNRMAWNWIQLNWERVVDRYGITDRNLGRLVPNIVSDYNTELQLWEVETFFERYPESGAGASGRVTALNDIKTNIAWVAENQQSIQDWLTKQLQP